jgi:CheY-like chemotaxis protein
MSSRTIEILLVEDNPGDIRLAQETLKDYKLQNAIHVVRDGVDALLFLRHQAPYESAPVPDLILLDLNLPLMDGVDVIAEMQKDPGLRNIPVVVLAASPHDRALLKDFDIPTDCFVVKPLTLDRYLEAVLCFPHLGLSIVRINSASA